jgi:hypothetical protein
MSPLPSLLAPGLLSVALQSISPEDAESLARRVARDLVDGRYEAVAETFDPGMKAAVSVAKLRASFDPIRTGNAHLTEPDAKGPERPGRLLF